MARVLSVASPEASKKRRRAAGTPDPDAEVVSLGTQTLLECGQGFQRQQNLQMHRRRHKVPWKLIKKEELVGAKKRVYVCPEASCLHHDPGHTLGDLVGIKKHYRRKHSDRRQWVCQRCDKGYAVHSDYKAHLKTRGTRGHTCDCARVFSRMESFIEHQDTCVASTDSNAAAQIASTWPNLSVSTAIPNPKLELQLLPPFTPNTNTTPSADEATAVQLQLSLAPYGGTRSADQEELHAAAAEKALADQARRQAKRQLELAQQEFANATRIRNRAQAELDKAHALRNNAAESISSVLFQVTCNECRKRLRPSKNSVPVSAMTDGERSRNSV